MKQVLLLVPAAILCMVASGALSAQENAQIGTWELRPAESRYVNRQTPMNETRTIAAQGKGAKVTVEGTAGDGSSMAYGYTTDYDGKDDRISGKGQPFGADTVAIKRVDANTTSIIEKKAGKVVATGTNAISNDGKMITITLKSAQDQSVITTIWEKL